MKKAYTVPELAKLYSMHPNTIRTYIKTGKLKAFKIDRYYRIPVDAVEQWEAELLAKRNKNID